MRPFVRRYVFSNTKKYFEYNNLILNHFFSSHSIMKDITDELENYIKYTIIDFFKYISIMFQ